MNPPGIIVIGAGPAGLAAAIAAARAGGRVTVLEQLPQPGRKLLASGGGRCNLTNTLSAADLATRFGRQWRFLLPALETLDPEALRRFFETRGVPLEAIDGFHYFPRSNRAGDLLEVLLGELARLGGELRCGVAATALRREDGRLRGVDTASGPLPADRVILAAGGRSYPALGSLGTGYELAAAAGHQITPPVPALVGLLTEETWPGGCTGIVLPDAEVAIDLPGERNAAGRGELLFTHRGLSGPAVLDLSGRVAELLARRHAVPLAVRLRADDDRNDIDALLRDWRQRRGRKQLSTLLAELLPARLAAALLGAAGLRGERRAAELTAAESEALNRFLAAAPLTATATEGWTRSMVTRGGVRLKAVDPQTLESRLLPGLFFAGEILDLDGPCGGYNLQWAFSSGVLAGRSAAAIRQP